MLISYRISFRIQEDKMSKRRRREIVANAKSNNALLLQFNTESNKTGKIPSTASDTNIAFQKNVSMKSASIDNLTHFTEYTIKVRACQDATNLTMEFCSLKAMTSVRTLAKGSIDSIVMRPSIVH